MNKQVSYLPALAENITILFNVTATVGKCSDTTSLETDTYVSDAVAFWFQLFVYVLLSGCVSIIGISGNIINIIVFVRQGIFTDNGSVTLFGLAVADLCCVASMLWLSISMSLVVISPPGLSWNPWDITYLTGGWPHLMFAQTTRMVTAYVAFERCVCVVLPFKVKSIFTPRRSIGIIVGIFVCFGLSHSPVFIMQQLKYRTDPETNTTRLVLLAMNDWEFAVNIMWYVNSIIFNIGAVVIVAVCTMVTVSRVKLSSVWRESMQTGLPLKSDTSQSIQDNTTSTKLDEETTKDISKQGVKIEKMSTSRMQKEKKLVRMITTIYIIMLACYVPDLALLTMSRINQEIRLFRRYQNLATVVYSLTVLFETFNSSINILFYYRMSSRYRYDLNLLLGLKGNEK